MTNYLNICASSWGNLGTTGCAFDPDQINGFIITPDTKAYTMNYATDAAFLTALKADAIAAAKNARIYPYFRVIDCVDNTAANSVQTSGYGIHIKTELGKPMLQLTMAQRGLHQLQSVYQFMGNNGIKLFLSDKRGFLWGQKTSTGTFCGFGVDVAPEAFKMAAGTNATEKKMNIYFKEEDAFLNPDKLDFYSFDRGTVLADELSGVHDVKLTLVSASTSAIVVKCQRADNLLDMGVNYETALELPTAWKLILVSTGAAVTITGVTYSSTAGTFTLAGTFATAANLLSLQDPTTLAGIATPLGNGQTGGFESNVLTVTPS